MLSKLSALVSNGQAVGAVTALVIAIFGVLVVTGTVKQAPDASFVSSVVAVTFTAAGLVLAYIQNSQHQQKTQQAADLAHVALALGISAQELAGRLQGTAKAPAAAAEPAQAATS